MLKGTSNKKSILIVEDSQSEASLYYKYLAPLDFNIQISLNGKDALNKLKEKEIDLILLDIQLPDMSGIQILKHIHKKKLNILSIIMTGNASIDLAINAMKLGAKDFILKPLKSSQIRISINKLLFPDTDLIQSKVSNAEKQTFIGSCPQMKDVFRIIKSSSKSKATIFITGESGTGKEICAETVHAMSTRSSKRFIALNCAAIPKDLMESEIFGHVKGAFTDASVERKGAAELVDGGTLFLDEICEMAINLQSKLLRFLQSGEYQKVGTSEIMYSDVKIVCATNRDPWEAVEKGLFRKDLFYRLFVIPIGLPPLRERGADILQIANSILLSVSIEESKKFTSFSSDTQEAFLRYTWPGNIRQLKNIITNIVVLNEGDVVEYQMLPNILKFENNKQIHIISSFDEKPQKTLDKIVPLWIHEKRYIEEVIELCDGNIPRAAKFLEVSSSTIYRKLQTWKDIN
ncbi:sigma-54-dependent Fis family transcriptional regulator [Paraphotobacterium marinum]|uniref:Sigma-54-dependent Fis family transcriptional regulator n=1 Tax=Paraphotobacterium marinum TaxID=1755811 RepID=A0A220VC05_9GAMM|nr:sigma-54 dependent transcriptional regulator [Paraphotobacterium marinum]ASK77702.1 sigma-54-dependent Fis family transcriptional regulator [Paraphotobacterium marinum]